jgi:membrane-bound serine protease (ClpP class)
MIALGLILALSGVTLLIAEAHLPTAGLLGAGGVIALAAGCWVLIAAAGGGVAIGLAVALVIVLAGTLALGLVARKVRLVGRRPARTGQARMNGAVAEVRAWDGTTGQVAVDGELWRAELAWPEEALPVPGQRVVVEQVDGLTLAVRTPEPWEVSS